MIEKQLEKNDLALKKVTVYRWVESADVWTNGIPNPTDDM